jgi:NAD(P)H-flavin reductase/ferredoxin
MPAVRYEGRSYTAERGETVLETLLRNSVEFPHSCRAGACQTCLARAASGDVPPRAQAGLKETWRIQGYFLTCLCRPEADLDIHRPGPDLRVPAVIDQRIPLSPSVILIRLRVERPFDFRAGQFVTLHRADGLSRSYSIASLPATGSLEIHVRAVPHGRMTTWLFGPESVGAEVSLAGPSGDCFYVPGRPHQPLILAGTGTGLAPLWGIGNDALAQGHRGPIHIFHGARNPAGLYLTDSLRALAARHPQVSYHPVVLEIDPGAAPDGVDLGPLDRAILARHPQLTGFRGFVCGDSEIVRILKKQLFLAGIASGDLSGDLFLSAPPPADS